MESGGTQSAAVTFRGGVPFAARFDDPYFADADGLAEAHHVFLAGNRLPERFRPGFGIGELGFGTGLNAIAAAAAWDARGPGGDLRMTSFEAFPIPADAMARALGRWPELARWSGPLIRAWRDGAREIALPGLELTVIEGDARERLPSWDGAADAWFLDGFSPAKNPELWEADLLGAVAARTGPGGRFATYSAAGHVRARLAAAGFAVSRVPGFGRKRHMTRGVLTA